MPEKPDYKVRLGLKARLTRTHDVLDLLLPNRSSFAPQCFNVQTGWGSQTQCHSCPRTRGCVCTCHDASWRSCTVKRLDCFILHLILRQKEQEVGWLKDHHKFHLNSGLRQVKAKLTFDRSDLKHLWWRIGEMTSLSGLCKSRRLFVAQPAVNCCSGCLVFVLVRLS